MIRALRQRLAAARTNDEGFTLIELLIVVVILGVLSGIVVFAVGNFNNDGVLAACKADKKSVEVATEAFYAKSTANPRVYPADPAALVTAGYLKEEPSSTKYAIAISSTGVVTSNMTGC